MWYFLGRLSIWILVIFFLFFLDTLFFGESRYLFIALTAVWVGKNVFVPDVRRMQNNTGRRNMPKLHREGKRDGIVRQLFR